MCEREREREREKERKKERKKERERKRKKERKKEKLQISQKVTKLARHLQNWHDAVVDEKRPKQSGDDRTLRQSEIVCGVGPEKGPVGVWGYYGNARTTSYSKNLFGLCNEGSFGNSGSVSSWKAGEGAVSSWKAGEGAVRAAGQGNNPDSPNKAGRSRWATVVCEGQHKVREGPA